MRERPEIGARLFPVQGQPAQPAQERDGRSEGRVPVGQSFHVEFGAFQERANLRARVTAVDIHRAIVRASQEFERRQIQN